MSEIDSVMKEIEDFCLVNMSREELFNDLLKQIREHTEKVANLKENEDRPGHMNEEIVDIMLLTKGLFYLENIEDVQVLTGAKYTLKKLKEMKENE